MTRARRALLLAPLFAAGCASPFAQSTAINWSGKPAPGTITVSDPKEYRREALINERSKETAWLDQLLDDSRTIDFKPEIAREVEQITALSGALGLSFDPAAGLSFRRAKDTGDLQQQIDVTRLQLQLDQLKRDADLVRSQFAAQTTPVNTDAAKSKDTSPAAATSTTAAAAADQLKSAVDKLTASLAGRLDAEGKPAALANTGFNPADSFRDRAAYRDLLKAARNAASLDELHDADGAALLRLNFHTTVFPDRKNASVPGVIQAKVIQSAIDPRDVQRVYAGWLDYLNTEMNVDDGGGVRANPELLRSAITDFFDVVQFRYPSAATPAPAPAKAAKHAKPVAAIVAAAASCGGLVLDLSQPTPAGCSTLYFAAPKLEGSSAQEGASSDLGKYLAEFHLSADDATDRDRYIHATETLANRASDLITTCGLPHKAAPGIANPKPINDLYLELELALTRLVGGSQFLAIDDRARTFLALRHVNVEPDPRVPLIITRMRRSEALLATLEKFAYAGCSDPQRRAYRNSAGQLFVPDAFGDALKQEGHVSIYEVGPRDLVQQVSTVARAANSLALAVSIAASAPGSGVGVNAAGSYSRQAIGRAAALERVPAVVGYSVRDAKTFGWVIGPLATIEPKGRIELDQTLREYDLTVDLSVPSWWPSFDVETTTAWAATATDIANGALGSSTTRSGALPSKKATVRRALNTADYVQLTAQLANAGVPVPRRATIAGIGLAGQSVDACRATTLLVKGDNVWRASVAMLNGAKLAADAVSVTPDMGGVLVAAPAINDLLGDVAGAQIKLTLLTPYGSASAMVDYARAPAAGCKAADKPKSDGPSVASVTPSAFRAPAAIDFQITGTKLDQITRATLNGQEGKLTPAKGGKALKISFTSDQTLNLPVSRTIPLSFFKGDDRVADQTVEVTENGGGK